MQAYTFPAGPRSRSFLDYVSPSILHRSANLVQRSSSCLYDLGLAYTVDSSFLPITTQQCRHSDPQWHPVSAIIQLLASQWKSCSVAVNRTRKCDYPGPAIPRSILCSPLTLVTVRGTAPSGGLLSPLAPRTVQRLVITDVLLAARSLFLPVQRDKLQTCRSFDELAVRNP
jgi:hypothetical protein